MATIGVGLVLISLLVWLGLLGGRGYFWRTDVRLEDEQHCASAAVARWPSVAVVIPARNEAELLPVTVRSLLSQHYPGPLTVIVVDDHSTDGTADLARDTALALGKASQLQVLPAAPLPAGWTGKLWAMEQGVRQAETLSPDCILLTDADIEHDPANLQRLVNRLVAHSLEMVSTMVRLRCDSGWEKLLIPAFVFFFAKLYPFRWVNDRDRPLAAAAGGCILIRRETLQRMGSIATVRHALIDDCALALAVKHSTRPYTPIWLGLSDRTRSLRPYDSLATLWDMVARTAYTQLHYSPLLLLGTLLGMTLVYLVPPIALLVGLLYQHGAIALLGLTTWSLMTLAYSPTVRFYHLSPWYATALPLIALLYTLMTLDSALRHWQGRGGAWKGRTYPH